jgi:hypothetical protein
MALSKGGKGNDRGLLFKLVQTSEKMARKKLQSDFAAVFEGLKDQDR